MKTKPMKLSYDQSEDLAQSNIVLLSEAAVEHVHTHKNFVILLTSKGAHSYVLSKLQFFN